MKRQKQPTIDIEKKKIKTIVESLSSQWKPEERETSILFDHHEKRVYFETSYPAMARQWFKNLWGDPNVKFDEKSSTLKISVPWEYCRSANLILKARARTYGQ